MSTNLCFEFTQTRGWEPRDRREDALAEYGDLVSWALTRGVLSSDEAERLRAWATSHAVKAVRALESAHVLRSLLYRVFRAIGTGTAVAEADVDSLNRWLTPARSAQRLERSGEEWGYGWTEPGSDLDPERPLWPIVVAAAELLTSAELDRVRVCAAEDCGWLFLDESRNRSRRWCDMSDCGNRAKARRYRARQRESGRSRGGRPRGRGKGGRAS